jgi:hypothetical protein
MFLHYIVAGFEQERVFGVEELLPLIMDKV